MEVWNSSSAPVRFVFKNRRLERHAILLFIAFGRWTASNWKIVDIQWLSYVVNCV